MDIYDKLFRHIYQSAPIIPRLLADALVKESGYLYHDVEDRIFYVWSGSEWVAA